MYRISFPWLRAFARDIERGFISYKEYFLRRRRIGCPPGRATLELWDRAKNRKIAETYCLPEEGAEEIMRKFESGTLKVSDIDRWI